MHAISIFSCKMELGVACVPSVLRFAFSAISTGRQQLPYAYCEAVLHVCTRCGQRGAGQAPNVTVVGFYLLSRSARYDVSAELSLHLFWLLCR